MTDNKQICNNQECPYKMMNNCSCSQNWFNECPEKE